MNKVARLLVFFTILTVIGTIFYGSTLSELFLVAIHRKGSSHSIFVPFFVGYLLWLRSNRIQRITPQCSWLTGMFFLLAGAGILMLGSQSQYFLVLSSISLLIVIGGLVLLLFGKAMLKEVLFPLVFLGAMIPLPAHIYTFISDHMRNMSTWGAVIIAKFGGVPLYREEFNIYLPEMNFFVAESCSGIRYLLSFLVFGLVYAYIFKEGAKPRILIVVSSIFVALLGSVIRLAAIFLGVYYINPMIADHTPHVILSWSIFVLLLLGSIVIDRFLSKKKHSKIPIDSISIP